MGCDARRALFPGDMNCPHENKPGCHADNTTNGEHAGRPTYTVRPSYVVHSGTEANTDYKEPLLCEAALLLVEAVANRRDATSCRWRQKSQVSLCQTSHLADPPHRLSSRKIVNERVLPKLGHKAVHRKYRNGPRPFFHRPLDTSEPCRAKLSQIARVY